MVENIASSDKKSVFISLSSRSVLYHLLKQQADYDVEIKLIGGGFGKDDTGTEFHTLLTEWIVPKIPGLHDRTDESGDSLRVLNPTYYTHFVEKKVHSLLDPLFTQKIRIIDLLATRIIDDLTDQFDNDNSDDVNNKFSISSCLKILTTFQNLDEDGNGLLTYEELLQYNECMQVLPLFIFNVFLTENTSDGEQIDFAGFLNFYNAVENKKLIQSMRWMFRVLDEGSKGYLTRKDIEEHADSLLKVVQERIPHLMASSEDLANEVFDISKPVNPTRITLKDIIDSGKGDTVMGMITNLDDYYTYETRGQSKAVRDQE